MSRCETYSFPENNPTTRFQIFSNLLFQHTLSFSIVLSNPASNLPLPPPAFPGTGWSNTEYRSFRFLDESDADSREVSSAEIEADAPLIEIEESRKRRGKTTPVPKRKEQQKLYEAALQGWEDIGLQNPGKMGQKEDLGEKKVPEGKEINGVRV